MQTQVLVCRLLREACPLWNVARAVCSERAWVTFFSANEEIAKAITLREDFISVAEIFCSDQRVKPCVQPPSPGCGPLPRRVFSCSTFSLVPSLGSGRGRGGSLFSCSTWNGRTDIQVLAFATLAFSTVLDTELVLIKLSLNKRLGFTSGSCKASSLFVLLLHYLVLAQLSEAPLLLH